MYLTIVSYYYWWWEVHIKFYMSWKVRKIVSYWIQIYRSKSQKHKHLRAGDGWHSPNWESYKTPSVFCPQRTGWCLFMLIRMIAITQYSKSNANLYQKLPYTSQSNSLPATWTFHSSVKFTYKINHDLSPQHLFNGCLHLSKMLQ